MQTGESWRVEGGPLVGVVKRHEKTPPGEKQPGKGRATGAGKQRGQVFSGGAGAGSI